MHERSSFLNSIMLKESWQANSPRRRQLYCRDVQYPNSDQGSGETTHGARRRTFERKKLTKVCTNGVRAVKRTDLQEDYSPEMDPQEVFIVVTSNACHFYRKHQRESRFLDQFENAGFVCLSIKTHKLGSPFASRRRPWMTWHGLLPLKA
jgi:hypothetical protein